MNAQAQHKDPGKQGEYYTDMKVGEILRRARVHYGQSLTDVEAMLRIRASQLQALEEGKLEELPGRVYAIGFVRAYSEYLGLDGDKMVNLFKAQSVGSKTRPELSFPVPASESKLPGIFILGGSFVAVLCLVLMFSFFFTGRHSGVQEEIPAVPPAMKTVAQAPVASALPAPTQQAGALPPQPGQTMPQQPVQAQMPTTQMQPQTRAAIAAANAATAAQPAQPQGIPDRLVINVKESTWVEVRNAGGKTLISQVLKPGDSFVVPNEPGLVLATGNIGGLEFVVDGNVIPPLGGKGDVKRGVRLDPDLLKPKNAARPAVRAIPPQPVPVQSQQPQPRGGVEPVQSFPLPGAYNGTAD